MGSILLKPVTIVAIIAVVSSGILFVANHTTLLPNRLPKAPPGTTFHAAQDAGAEVTPSHVESPIKPKPAGPAPAAPANPTSASPVQSRS
ncbi:MAG: hypothetical protein JSS22_16500 [Proteobacteria bacterium]|nr:hypothetical protein [Pseudomonadota bacterium]